MSVDVGVVNGSAVRREHWYPPIELIPWCFLVRLARTIEEGARKYGTYNFMKEDYLFIRDIPRHVTNHMLAYCQGDRSEDHIGHASWGLMALAMFEHVLGDECMQEIFHKPIEDLEKFPGSGEPLHIAPFDGQVAF